MSKPRKKRRPPKRTLALPDLEQSKAAVLNSLTSKSGQRTYDRAVTDFVDWFCSEPRLSFNRAAVLRYGIYFECVLFSDIEWPQGLHPGCNACRSVRVYVSG
jgi:hypothetical protein